jgi:ADP-ribose pyrophosphatase YjhB (NUDIX family)
MNVGASGLVVNQTGELLVIQRDDTRTWAIPGGSLEPGEMASEGVVREIEEETGLKVLPVRLVSIDFVPWGKRNLLLFMFRCLRRGGEERTSTESLQVGYTPTHPLSLPMLRIHRERIERGLTHQGGPPFWQQYELNWREHLLKYVLGGIIYPYKNWRQRRRGQPYVPPTPWSVAAYVVIRNPVGDALWVKPHNHSNWTLPGGRADDGEAPWDAAVRWVHEQAGLTVELSDLVGVYTLSAQQDMALVFTARIVGETTTRGSESAELAYFTPGTESESARSNHVERVSDAIDANRDVPLFKRQQLINPN